MEQKQYLLFDCKKATLSTKGVYNAKVKQQDDIKSFAISSCIFTNPFPTVVSATTISPFANNVIKINYLTTDYVITLSEDVYTATELATEFTSKLTSALGVGWSCIFDTAYLRFGIIGAGNFTMYTSQYPNFANLFGWPTTDLTGALTYDADKLPQLAFTRYVTLHSNTLGALQQYSSEILGTNSTGQHIAFIPLTNSGIGSVETYEPEQPRQYPFATDRNAFNNLDFYFMDEYGYMVDWRGRPPTIYVEFTKKIIPSS
jgi:hypothetical protein